MKYIVEDDFSTDFSDDVFVPAVMTDNDQIITYGHITEEEMLDIVKQYLTAWGETDLDPWLDGHHQLSFRWAVLVDSAYSNEDRHFRLLKEGESIDEFAAPITVIQF